MWLTLSLLAALFYGITQLYSKKLTKTYNEYTLAFVSSAIIAICLLPFVMSFGTPKLGSSFWLSLIIVSIINAITAVLVFKALKLTNISLVAPIYALSPVFLIFTSPFIINESPSATGLLGVFLVLAGAYILNFKGKANMQPILDIYKNKGQKIILLVCLLWAISTNFYKIGMQSSSAIFFIFATSLTITLFLLPIIIFKRKLTITKSNWLPLLTLGVLGLLSTVTEWLAVNNGIAIYVLSIRRLSIFVVILGAYIFFKEKQIKQRLLASFIMFIGVLIIYYSSTISI